MHTGPIIILAAGPIIMLVARKSRPLLLVHQRSYFQILLHTVILVSSAAPFKAQLAMSPLVAVQRAAAMAKPPLPHTPTTTRHTVHTPTTTRHTPHPLTQDVSSPAAARARASAVNGNLEASAATLKQQPHIPLQRAVLLSAGEYCNTCTVLCFTGDILHFTPNSNCTARALTGSHCVLLHVTVLVLVTYSFMCLFFVLPRAIVDL